MIKVLDRLKTEPVYLFAVLQALVGMLIATEVLDANVGGALATVMAVLGGGTVRRAVTPVNNIIAGIERIGGIAGGVVGGGADDPSPPDQWTG